MVRARVLDSVASDEVVAELYARGADAEAVRMIVDRGLGLAMLVGPMPLAEAQALRKLAKDDDVLAVLTRPAGRQDPARAEVVLLAPAAKLRVLGDDLGGESGRQMNTALANYALPRGRALRCRDRSLALGEKTLIMGIVNVTPDSFSGDGLGNDAAAAIARGKRMAAEGADILDVGGESTRPGAEPVSLEEELGRVLPVIEGLAAETQAVLSIDTYKSAVAVQAVERGAAIVNDISGLRFDAEMGRVAAKAGAAVIIMHIQGTPRSMQEKPKYDDVIGEISDYLGEGMRLAAKAGIGPDQMVVDPGFGFGKTVEHNLELMRRLGELRGLGVPVMIGPSRKRTLGTLLNDAPPNERREGTAAMVALAIAAGADIVRVHDVREMARVARVADAVVRVKHEPPAGSDHKWAHQRGTETNNDERR